MMDRLDEIIECCDEWNSGSIKELAVLLTELKQRRESDLRPADKFLGNTIASQYEHVISELDEVQEEMYPGIKYIPENELKGKRNISKLIEELIDMQMSIETMIAIAGFDEQQRRDARRKVIEKNESRGYYRKGEE